MAGAEFVLRCVAVWRGVRALLVRVVRRIYLFVKFVGGIDALG